jgi:hypothetical protein
MLKKIVDIVDDVVVVVVVDDDVVVKTKFKKYRLDSCIEKIFRNLKSQTKKKRLSF